MAPELRKTPLEIVLGQEDLVERSRTYKGLLRTRIPAQRLDTSLPGRIGTPTIHCCARGRSGLTGMAEIGKACRSVQKPIGEGRVGIEPRQAEVAPVDVLATLQGVTKYLNNPDHIAILWR